MGERARLLDDPELLAACEGLVRAAARAGLTLGCAESCTGGLVSGCLTAVPGSSEVVLGGIVSYAVDVKRRVLGLSGEVLDAPGVGAVSGACAREMAEGARRVLGCDVAVSVTGIAGPGGAEPGKPVGTVWLGLATPGRTIARHMLFEGGRAEVRRSAVAEAVRLLREGVGEASGATVPSG